MFDSAGRWNRGPVCMSKLHRREKQALTQNRKSSVFPQCQSGQAGIMVALILAVAVLCAAAVSHTGELTLAKMQAQIAADAGAQTAAAVLADGLNTVAITNVILVGGTLLVPITEGLSGALARGAHVAQQVAVNTTPALSITLGETAAFNSGADFAVPTVLPEMHLQRAALGYEDLLSYQDKNVRHVGFAAMKEPKSIASGFAGNLVDKWKKASMISYAKGVVIWDGFGLEMIRSFIPAYEAGLTTNL